MTELRQGTFLQGRRICVVTPVPLTRDSRTLKQIYSLRRSGAIVLAVAGGERVTKAPTYTPQDDRGQTTASNRGLLSHLWNWVRSTRQPAVVVAPFFAAWLCIFFWRTALLARKLPLASTFVLHGVTTYPAYALSRCRAPFIYDIHDLYCGVEPETALGTFERAFLRPFLRYIERKCIEAAMTSVTVSDGLAKIIEQSYGTRPVVIRNCHDSRLDAEETLDIRVKLRLANDEFLIVAIGNRKEGQRFDSLFAALKTLSPDAHVALIGRGYEALLPSIASAGLSHRVHIVGALPPWSIVPSVRSANLAALPYYGRSENYSLSLPNGFFQSVGAKLPLLYPDLPEMRALAEDYDLGLMVDWSSTSDITAKIGALQTGPDLYSRLRKNAVAAASILSWQNEEKPWLAIVAEADNSTPLPLNGTLEHGCTGTKKRSVV